MLLQFNIDALVKSPKSPFDKLRANGGVKVNANKTPDIGIATNHDVGARRYSASFFKFLMK